MRHEGGRGAVHSRTYDKNIFLIGVTRRGGGGGAPGVDRTMWRGRERPRRGPELGDRVPRVVGLLAIQIWLRLGLNYCGKEASLPTLLILMVKKPEKIELHGIIIDSINNFPEFITWIWPTLYYNIKSRAIGYGRKFLPGLKPLNKYMHFWVFFIKRIKFKKNKQSVVKIYCDI